MEHHVLATCELPACLFSTAFHTVGPARHEHCFAIVQIFLSAMIKRLIRHVAVIGAHSFPVCWCVGATAELFNITTTVVTTPALVTVHAAMRIWHARCRGRRRTIMYVHFLGHF